MDLGRSRKGVEGEGEEGVEIGIFTVLDGVVGEEFSCRVGSWGWRGICQDLCSWGEVNITLLKSECIICQVRDIYRLGNTLGSGGFAVVRMATHKTTYQQFACKIMTLPAVGAVVADTENSREDIFREIEILCGLEHKNIVELQVMDVHPLVITYCNRTNQSPRYDNIV